MKEFFDRFGSLNGAKFIGINGYTNKHGEVANLTVNANVNIRNAKEKDLNTLKSLTEKDLDDITLGMFLINPPDIKENEEYKKLRSTMDVALKELIASAEKNLSADMDDRTNQSKAQTEAYIHICPSVKLHKETMNIFVEGFLNNKTKVGVVCPECGTMGNTNEDGSFTCSHCGFETESIYPVRNKREKTKCKDAIAKHCDLSMNKYRMYNVGSMESIKMTGNTLQIL